MTNPQRLKTVAVIPARLGSERLPGKNMREFQGQPLISFSIKAALHCNEIEQVIVSTNDPDVEKIAKQLGVDVITRPEELATATATTASVLQHTYEQIVNETGDAELGPEFLVLLQPTSPLREAGMISEGLASIRADQKATSLMAVCPVQMFTGQLRDGYWIGDYPETTRSQDIPKSYIPSGSLYIYRCKETIAKGECWGTHVLPLVVDYASNVNVDEPSDWQTLESAFSANRSRYEYLL